MRCTFTIYTKIFPLKSSSGGSSSSEDTFGTVIFRGQIDEPEQKTPKSRLGIQEKTSSSSHEDSVMNLAEVISFSHTDLT